uniref:Globin family profile domain-containing protein n=1 Tax=Setaria digitata TaxID=48799 RepID=A0A915Q2Q5_9BILA
MKHTRYHNPRPIISTQPNTINRISIENSQISSSVISNNIGMNKYQSIDNSNTVQQHHDLPGPSTERRIRFLPRAKTITKEENEKRLKFISTHGSLTMRSFDTGHVSDVEVTMKPLKDRSRSMSPLKQLKTYSFRSIASEESILSEMQQELIRKSWQAITSKLEHSSYNFGFFVYRRVFERNPSLKRAFHLEECDSLELLPKEHSIFRQIRLFANLISLAVRHVNELETEIAPAIFRYGQRHYKVAGEYFNEETVRLFCSQVVCTVADLLEVDVDPICMEAWIDMMRFIGSDNDDDDYC